jgi:hypothetical protein
MTGVQGLRGEPEFAGRRVVVSHLYRITRQDGISRECSILNSVKEWRVLKLIYPTPVHLIRPGSPHHHPVPLAGERDR